VREPVGFVLLNREFPRKSGGANRFFQRSPVNFRTSADRFGQVSHGVRVRRNGLRRPVEESLAVFAPCLRHKRSRSSKQWAKSDVVLEMPGRIYPASSARATQGGLHDVFQEYEEQYVPVGFDFSGCKHDPAGK
jgi:hypothetical protein